MEKEPEVLVLHEDNLITVIQYFFDNTKWGEECDGHLEVDPDEWDGIIERFDRLFKKNPITKEYKVTDQLLYMFINNEIALMIDNTMKRLCDMGLCELVVREDGEIAYRQIQGEYNED